MIRLEYKFTSLNAYISADNMTRDFWDNSNDVEILSVKVYVLARDILPDDDYTNTNTYWMGDNQVVVNDSFRRLLLVSTVSLHSSGIEAWL